MSPGTSALKHVFRLMAIGRRNRCHVDAVQRDGRKCPALKTPFILRFSSSTCHQNGAMERVRSPCTRAAASPQDCGRLYTPAVACIAACRAARELGSVQSRRLQNLCKQCADSW